MAKMSKKEKVELLKKRMSKGKDKKSSKKPMLMNGNPYANKSSAQE